MTEMICGTAHSSREAMLFERIREMAADGGVIAVVPDQYSFEFDKKLYDFLGARLFNSIETEGISRLCDKICRSCGGKKLTDADSNSKLIAMYKAQSQLRNENCIMIYRKSLLRPSFVSDCISLVGKLIHAGASPETLRIAAESTIKGSARLNDIAIIFERYIAVLGEMGLCESLSDAERAARLAKENGFFKGRKVFFDAFTGFSPDELSLVSAVISQADASVFSFVCGEIPDGQDPFAVTRRTISKIENIAQDYNISAKITKASGCDQTAPLEHINRYLYSYNAPKADSQGMVKVVAATDIYEESEYVCSEISRLVREGSAYNDIAVICGNLEDSAQIFGSVAERYSIPYFVDKSRSALTSVPVKYLLGILDAVLTEQFRTENILRLVKSPLSPFLDYDACDLEDYCVKWRVDRDMWLSEFRLEEGRSDRIEKTRSEIIGPLVKFRKACEKATAAEICNALYTLLDELEMSKQIYSAVESANLENETDFEVNRGFRQVWTGMVTAIKSIYSEMGDEHISLRAFSELLKLMMSGITISSPPQKADCVRVAEAGRSRLSDVKTLFVIQSNDGVFPHSVNMSGLLGDDERASLEKLGTELDDTPKNSFDSERIDVYLSLTAPTERLYITYSEADRTGSALTHSDIVTSVMSVFSDDIKIQTSLIDRKFFCTSYKTAYYNYLAHSKDRSVSSESIHESLMESGEYREKLEFVEDAVKAKEDRISEDLAKQLFFPKDMNLSATRVSNYYQCPFSYFCKYGLKLQPTGRVEMNSQYVGIIAHHCLEHIMSREENGRRVYDEYFTSLTDEQLFERIDSCTDEFVENQMGGSFGKTLGFKHSVERLKKSVLSMAVNFRDELNNSLFLPAAFELDLTDENGEAVLSVELEDAGTRIQLRGFVDRADIYETEMGSWIRIVDYKTGKQNFKESEVYHGLDLQMLLYLLAVTSEKCSISEGRILEPAGIMYSHIRNPEPVLSASDVLGLESDGLLEDRIRLENSKCYKPDGLMLGEEIFDGLNKEHNGVYTIFTLNKDGSVGKRGKQPVSQEKLKAMTQFALNKVVEMGEALHKGDIKAFPVETSTSVHCTYCDYKALCRNPSPLKTRKIQESDKELLEQELKKITEGSNSDK